MAAAVASSPTIDNLTEGSGDDSPDSLDERFTLPLLFPPKRSAPGDSRKARLMLGLVTKDSEPDRGRRHRPTLTRTRSRSEERFRSGHHSLDVSEKPQVPALRKPTRPVSLVVDDSEKALRLLGLIADVRSGRQDQRKWAPTLTERSRSEERSLSQSASVLAPSELVISLSPTSRSLSQDRLRSGHDNLEYTTQEQVPVLRVQTRGFSLPAMAGGETASPRLNSSAGKRASIHTNFSRPLSVASPKFAPLDFLKQERGPSPPLRVARDDIGLPRTPSRNTLALAKPIFAKVGGDKNELHPYQQHRRSSVWMPLPSSLICFSSKRKSVEHKPNRALTERRRKYEKLALTEENLRHFEGEVGSVPRMLNQSVLPTPLQSPVQRNGLSFSERVQKSHGKRLPTPPQSPFATPHSAASSSPLTAIRLPTGLQHDIPPAPPPKDFPKHPKERVAQSVSLYPVLVHPICEICRDPRPPETFPIRQTTTKCIHPPHTCLQCIQKWIETCIQNRGWDQCVCPECGEGMGYADLQFFAPVELFNRYEEIATRAALSAIEDFYYCLSPHCTSGQIHILPISEHPTFVCLDCGHMYCLNHPSTPYHSGLSCEEYDVMIASPSSSTERLLHHQVELEREGEEKVRQIGKRCPNALCGWWIEKKSEGCDHMTCWKCRFGFCWECGAPFEPILRKGGKLHRPGCKYWG